MGQEEGQAGNSSTAFDPLWTYRPCSNSLLWFVMIQLTTYLLTLRKQSISWNNTSLKDQFSFNTSTLKENLTQCQIYKVQDPK